MNQGLGRCVGLVLGLWALAPGGLVGQATPSNATPSKAKPKGEAAVEKTLALGERMYRKGILPSGEIMQTVVSGKEPVAGTVFTCVSCHGRAGLESFEGGIYTLATSGAKLGQPRYGKYPNLSMEERTRLKLQAPPVRPAYTDEALAKVLRTGVDPAGRELHQAMPRYDLTDRDMALLIQYLRGLSAKHSPGVDATTIRFATVITEEVSPEDQQAMLVPLNNYVARHNQLSNGFGNRMYMSIGGEEMSGGYRKLALSVWRLKGAPSTWGRQLAGYLAKEPVFALLGGISYGDWKPIHTFCETNKLPCLLPITDFPVITEGDWYTQYFSKGYYQEGQAVAQYLRSLNNPSKISRVLQIIQDGPAGRDLSAGFRETWQDMGQGPAKELHLKKGDVLTPASLRALVEAEKPSVVLLWANAGEATAGLAEQSGRPELVFLSSRLLGAKSLAVPEAARAFTYLTYPFREPKDEAKYARFANSLLAGLATHKPETRISTRTYSVIQLLRLLLTDMDRNFYRDNFMDRVGMQPDQVLPDFVRLSFGPSQRYASKGCYIMQLGPGPEPQLVPKSEWVIH